MHTIASSLIIAGFIFNCCAIAFLFIEGRKRDQQEKIFRKNLEEIYYHLRSARRAQQPAIDKLIAAQK